jgi:hypothetical protein
MTTHNPQRALSRRISRGFRRFVVASSSRIEKSRRQKSQKAKRAKSTTTMRATAKILPFIHSFIHSIDR